MHKCTAPGKGYHIFAGKDGSRGLGMSSLKPEDAVPDYSTLDDKQLKVLDDWVSSQPGCNVVYSESDPILITAILRTPSRNSTRTTPSDTTLSARSLNLEHGHLMSVHSRFSLAI